MRTAILLTVPFLAAFGRSDDMVADFMRQWIGRPISDYVSERSKVPTGSYDAPDGSRVFIFTNPLGCGTTITTHLSGRSYVIAKMSSTCSVNGL